MKRWLLIGILVLIGGFAAALLVNRDAAKAPTRTTETESPAKVETVAEGLEIPWEVAFAPDGRLFVTERPGRVRVIRDGKLQKEPLLTIETTTGGEGGLQGMALDPDFATNRFVYLYASSGRGNDLINRIIRYREADGRLVEPRILLDNIPGNNNHNGGRLAFGPDKKLYATTGDSQEPSLAQDKGSLAGKILRLNSDGSTPADNPFGSLVWSYGHRNPQGLAWDKSGQLYSVEHGPSGDLGLCCRDELNKIDKGGNYGWPVISGDQTRDGLISPLLQSGNRDTWAPAGLAITPDGTLYFATLRGTHLRAVTVRDGQVTGERELFKDEFGRLRAVTVGPDGKLYLSTSNRDGRGKVRAGDDKILRFSP